MRSRRPSTGAPTKGPKRSKKKKRTRRFTHAVARTLLRTFLPRADVDDSDQIAEKIADYLDEKKS